MERCGTNLPEFLRFLYSTESQPIVSKLFTAWTAFHLSAFPRSDLRPEPRTHSGLNSPLSAFRFLLSPHKLPRPVTPLNFQHLRCLFAELADDADGDLLALLHRERMAGVAVNTSKGFVVDFHF